jgi:hypothetical protein
VTCKRDATHKSTADATVTVKTTDATCEETGKKVYTAKATFNGAEYSSTKEVVLPALGHNLTLVEAQAASIRATGNSAYYKCERCGKFFSDAEGTTEISAVPTISWVHVAAIDPTQSARGFKEFYLKSGTGEVSFTAPENAAYSTITLTDEEKTSFINNDTNNVTIPSFDELDAMYSGHEGTMPYDGEFLSTAKASYDLYSDAAKTKYGKDVDAMYTAWGNAYEVANAMDKWSSGWDGKYLDKKGETYKDKTAGTVRHLTVKDGQTLPIYATFHVDVQSKISENAKGVVIFIKGVADASINAPINKQITSKEGYGRFRLGGSNTYNSSAIDYIADGWYAVYFTDSAMISDLNNAKFTNFITNNIDLGTNDFYVSPLYTIKKSNYYGSDVQAFPLANDATQNYNNACYAYSNVGASNVVGASSYYNPLFDTNVFEGKGNNLISIGRVGVDGPNTSAAKGALKKMVDGTLTSAYFYFYSSVDTLTGSLQYRNSGNGWTKIYDTYTVTGKGWHKIPLDNANVLKELNAADGTKVSWLDFSITSGNTDDSGEIPMRITGIYGTLAA